MPAAVRNKGSRRHHSVSFINLQMIHLAERAKTLSSRLVRSPAGAGLGLSKSLRSFNDAAPAEPSNVGGGLGGATAEKAGYRHRRLLRARRERPRGRRAAKCGQQIPPSDGDCHTPLPREVRKRKDTTPPVCCPNTAAPGASGGTPGTGCNGAPPGRPIRLDFKRLFSAGPFTSSRACGTMLTRAVFSEGGAARPITASQPPVRAD